MSDSSMQALVSDVEKELLQVIIDHMKDNSMTEEQARTVAQEFLALLPMHDKKDLLTKLYDFSQKHVETKSLYLKYAKPYEEEERQRKLTLMSEHIKNGQIEHALTVAKGEAN
jgi:hypothetical protein